VLARAASPEFLGNLGLVGTGCVEGGRPLGLLIRSVVSSVSAFEEPHPDLLEIAPHRSAR
jgi:hypothetical protein